MATPTVEQLTGLAAEVTAAYDTALARIRNDRQLSAEGRRDQIAARYIDTVDAVAKIRDSYTGGNDAEIARLEDELTKPRRGIFATPADRVAVDTSYRDALQRSMATAPNTTELADLWALARAADDELLAKAAVVVAIERPDIGMLRHVATIDPDLGVKVSRLFDLRSGKDSVRNTLGLWMQVPDPSVPPELATIGAGSIGHIRAHVEQLRTRRVA